MTRKFKKGLKGQSIDNDQSFENKELIELIDARKSQFNKQNKVSKVVNDHNNKNKSKKKKNKHDKNKDQIHGAFLNETRLMEQFSSIFQKFEVTKVSNDEQVKLIQNNKRKHNNDDNKNRDENENEIETENGKNKYDGVIDSIGPDKQENEGKYEANKLKQLSRRKLRKLNKPNLIDLKSRVPHPEVIEWYDCDARYPLLNATIKSTKNVVGIPSHWQLKREYLSGRSLLNKKPFELPDIMKQTNIESMRNVLANGDQQQMQDSSLKEMTRIRVQPRLGTLDIDYKKLYDIFFKLGSTWKPDILLPFGDLYYENRNLEEEAQWERIKRTVRPGKISKSLREVMGMKEGQLPPWCHKMEKLGMPPSYPNMKIAGLNWDIQFLKDEIYGKIPKVNKKNDLKNTTYFGQILNFEDSTDENENKGLDTGIEANLEDDQTNNTKSKDGDVDKQLITEVEVVKAVDNNSVQGIEANILSKRPLYTVLQETINQTGNEYTMNKKYSIAGQPSQLPSESDDIDSITKSEQKFEIEDDEEEQQLRKFKF